MNEAELRESLRRQRYLIPDDVWDQLREEGYVKRALSGDKADKGKLLKAAYQQMAWSHHAHPGRRAISKTTQEPIVYEPGDLLRALALSDYYAALAAEWPDVRGYREEVLGGSVTTTEKIRSAARHHHETEETVLSRLAKDGITVIARLLNPQEAQAFLTSPATAILSLDQFRKWRIPVIGHHARRCRAELADHSGRADELTVTPPALTDCCPSGMIMVAG